MDSLVDSLQSSFAVTKDNSGSHSTDKKHPRFDQYKCRGEESNSQNSRRKQFLERQKSKRCDAQLLARKIAEDNLSDIERENEDFEDDGSIVQDDYSSPSNAFTTSGLCSYSSRPRKQHKTPRLMLSEWLVDVPEDFETSCYVMPCPVGKRNLVTASQGYCTAWTKFGVKVQYEFESELPNAYTILDCVYSPPENKYYCLDLLCWNGHPFLDCETEFRFFWLQTKFQEHPEITKKSKFNRSPFEVLPYFPCTEEGIVSAIRHFPPEKLDGLWFFHRQTHYHLGVTPLVGWLKPHMVSTVLSVQVPLEYSEEQAQLNKQKLKQKKKVVHESTDSENINDKQSELDAKENKWFAKANTSSSFTTTGFNSTKAYSKNFNSWSDHSKKLENKDEIDDDFDMVGASSVRMHVEKKDFDEMMSGYLQKTNSSKGVKDFDMNSNQTTDFSSDW
ncbi:snurportin-1-like isoform X2 [Convolutriloba macropyga]|uniref:snurportin-1-like isoform X2 n=1 Tax=Convolutriloba macropyga TaxID=536237 RepID=UPI003F51DB15